jgi:hypothetical protein
MGSPYHTVHGSDTLHGVVVNPISDSFFRQHRSNSWSDSLDDIKNLHSASQDVIGGGGGMFLNSSGNNNVIASNNSLIAQQMNNLQGSRNVAGTTIKENSSASMTSSGYGSGNNPSSPAILTKPLIQVSRGIVLDPSFNRKFFFVQLLDKLTGWSAAENCLLKQL